MPDGTMTAGELIAVLSEVHAETIIVLAKDSEGNRYSPLAGYDNNSGYLAETTWSGSINPLSIDDEDRAAGWTDEDVSGPDHVRCVVLWPVN